MESHTVTILVLFLLIILVTAIVGSALYFICLAICHKARFTSKRHLQTWIPNVLQGRRPTDERIFYTNDIQGDNKQDTTEKEKETSHISTSRPLLQNDFSSYSLDQLNEAILGIENEEATIGNNVRLQINNGASGNREIAGGNFLSFQ